MQTTSSLETTDLTAEQVRRRARGHIHCHLGNFLWAGEPTLDAQRNLWVVPIHSRALTDEDIVGSVEVNRAGTILQVSEPKAIQAAIDAFLAKGHRPPAERRSRPEDFVTGEPQLSAEEIAILVSKDDNLRQACQDVILALLELPTPQALHLKAVGYSLLNLGDECYTGKPRFDEERQCWTAVIHAHALRATHNVVGRMDMSATGDILRAPTRYELWNTLDALLREQSGVSEPIHAPAFALRGKTPVVAKLGEASELVEAFGNFLRAMQHPIQGETTRTVLRALANASLMNAEDTESQ